VVHDVELVEVAHDDSLVVRTSFPAHDPLPVALTWLPLFAIDAVLAPSVKVSPARLEDSTGPEGSVRTVTVPASM
jgi:hypothetical protein